jgi:hypothetical protein
MASQPSRRQRWWWLVALVLVALAAAVGSCLQLRSEAPPSPRLDAGLGVYVGPAAVEDLRGFESWLGRDVGLVVDFISDTRWSDIAYPSWWAEAWSDVDRRVVFSLPLLPRNDGTLAEGAAGRYDEVFAATSRTLIDSGHGDAIVRLGWEFNLDTSPWRASEDPEAFISYWRRVVDVMRAEEGAAFQFDWTTSAGPTAINPEEVYPGDEYVDIIGLDAYDYVSDRAVIDPESRWTVIRTQDFGLEWHRDFAEARGKPLSFPEWGVWERPDGGGGGDNPLYIERMHSWFQEVDPAYHAYFEHRGEPGEHELQSGQFPRAAARFKELFGR